MSQVQRNLSLLITSESKTQYSQWYAAPRAFFGISWGLEVLGEGPRHRKVMNINSLYSGPTATGTTLKNDSKPNDNERYPKTERTKFLCYCEPLCSRN